MPITRTFIDWSSPALPSVAAHLLRKYGSAEQADLSAVVVVLTGRRACRRLLELLVECTSGRLHPPVLITESQLPELLYDPQRPFAGRVLQQMAWGEAVRRLPRPMAERLLQDVPDDRDADGWMALGALLWKLHRELAAEQLNFGDVLQQGERIVGFGEWPRWEALGLAQQEYLSILDDLDLWDRQTARLVAIDKQECHSTSDIVLVGTVDLNRTTRAMLDLVADRVTALIHAPAALSDRFDAHGCLVPDAWLDVPVEIDESQLLVVDGPAAQADALIRTLAGFNGRYRADDITIGLAEESIVPQLQRRLRQYDVPARWVIGKTLPQTSLVRLLEAAADFIESRTSEHFAALVRHPDVGDWLRQNGLPTEWLGELDEYLSEHLQQTLGFWLGHSTRSARLRMAYDQVTALLAGLADDPKPLPEWAEQISNLPLAIFGNRDLDPECLEDRAEIEAFKSLQAALTEQASLPESLAPVVGGGQALRLTLELLETEAVPPPRDDEAVELLGWLELPLDDAPALIVTSFNEPYVPSSVDADLFLPNRLRQALEILDNNRRYARDAYVLTALRASRKELRLIAARQDAHGDPLLPSRLALACPKDVIAHRIETFFESTSSVPPLAPFGNDVTAALPLEPRGLAPPRPQPLAEPKNHVRVTAFRDYIACPYRFYLRHILKLESMGDRPDELSPGQFGSLVHAVLEDFGRSDQKGATEARLIHDYLCDRLEERAARDFGRRRSTSIEVQLIQLRRRLEAFAQWQAQRTQQGWSIAFVEEAAGGQTAELVVDEFRSVFVHGRIDRIDRHASGAWAILDYKTGEEGLPPEKAHRAQGEWIDLQLPLYRHLAATLGVAGEVGLGYLVLPRESHKATDLMADWSAEDLRSADERAIEIARRILDQEFLPMEEWGLDPYDDFAAICQEGVFFRRPPA